MREWWSKVTAVFGGRRPVITEELDEEVNTHLAFEAEENRDRGMTAEQARRSANQAFGNRTIIMENARDTWRFSSLETFINDFGLALRMMRKAPIFAIAAILTLGLGIGANTAIFSVIRGVLLKPLEYRQPNRLVRISIDNARQGYEDVGFTLVRYQEMKASAQSFSALGAFFIATEHMTLSGAAEPEQVTAARVSANFLDVLGIKPLLGRGFLPAEDRRGGAAVALISAQLWKRRFGGGSGIVGRTIDLNATPHSIVGVLPEGFAFPSPGLDLWVPRPAEYSEIPPQFWNGLTVLIGLGRLRPGVTIDEARKELRALNQRYVQTHPEMADAQPGVSTRVRFVRDQLVENVRPMLWILLGAVAFVLIIACANVASLLLARATSRSREFAVRTALGAARGRLIGQLLAESVLLAVIGGAVGALLAKGCLKALAQVTAFRLPRAGEIHLDATVLAFTAALSIATGVFFGLFPAFQLSRPVLGDLLRERSENAGTARSSAGVFRISIRSALVVGQVALSVLLLIGAALLMKSFVRLHRVNTGFRPAHLLTMRIDLPPARYNTPQKKEAFLNELLRRIQRIPGIDSASASLTLPMSPRHATGVQVFEQPMVKLSERPAAQLQSVTPGYFRTAGIPMRRGREFTERDNAVGAPLVLMINESMARRFWPGYPRGIDPVGQHLLIGSNTINPFEIIGIAADVHERGFPSHAIPEIYLPTHSYPLQSAGLLVRTESEPLHFVGAIRREVLAIDKDQPIADVQTMNELLESSVGQQRLTLILLGGFAGMALTLAAIGIYGLIAYSVVQRNAELGIRRALGAQASDILGLVVGQSVVLTLTGLALGLVGAFALTRVMKALLFQVTATDPIVFAGVALVFLAVALGAACIPAVRATRVNPMVALR